ncbi:ABC transporter permease [Ihubacter sp. rT4E-8]|uniref:ABC transporter permease n=1 Tax=Ihubacter sp. rT4E-8 TaxID=3242369 RepID=UPI003CF555E3
MKGLPALVWRNTKLFFKDKGMFFTSLITPLILLVLFVTFLGNVYRDSLDMTVADVPGVSELPESLVEGFVGGWLFSSLLAVCCVTVAFCANMLMVQDKVTGARTDLTMAPVGRGCLAMGYYISTAISTLIICFIALGACFVYLGKMGWYLSEEDMILTCLDVMLLTMFGTALSSVVNHFLSTQGQISAVGTIVSAGYGFICGAYMPISQFSEGIQTFISFLPGTYGTALLHSHLMRGTYEAMEDVLPVQAVDGLRGAFDSDLVFQGHTVTEPEMYLVLGGAVVILIGVYVALGKMKRA